MNLMKRKKKKQLNQSTNLFRKVDPLRYDRVRIRVNQNLNSQLWKGRFLKLRTGDDCWFGCSIFIAFKFLDRRRRRPTREWRRVGGSINVGKGRKWCTDAAFPIHTSTVKRRMGCWDQGCNDFSCTSIMVFSQRLSIKKKKTLILRSAKINLQAWHIPQWVY